MLLNLGRAITRSSKSLKPVFQAGTNYAKKVAPLTPALTLRTFSIQIPKHAEIVEANVTPPPKLSPEHEHTPQTLLNVLEECRQTGKMMDAITTVQTAQDLNLATPELYLRLINILGELPFELQECAVVAHWFYSPKSELPAETLNNLDIWKSLLKLGFNFGSTYRAEDLSNLVRRFTHIFDLSTLEDETMWALLIRAYGIIHKSELISDSLAKIENNQNNKSIVYSSALLSYAAVNSHENVEKMLEKLKETNSLSHRTLLKLIRCYGFNGDISRTSKYVTMYNTLYPDECCNVSMLLIAHKVALQKIHKHLSRTRGSQGLNLKPVYLTELDQIHASWTDLTNNLLKDSTKSVDITDCNVILEYLTIANHIDPVQFPMEKAEEFLDSYMPNHSIKPDDVSYQVMLTGYSASQQYKDIHRNIRLHKALEIIVRMQSEGIKTLKHSIFHALFHACLPHRNGHYYFDNFRLNSLLPTRPYAHNRFNIDPRIFEIEKIMLEGKLPHDRFTLTTMLTCLASGGQFKAFRRRWNALKLYGLRRDIGMYRLVFALSSLDPTESKYAIAVIRNEMKREIPKDRMDWDTYRAMLDCCISAQLPIEAKEIMKEMTKNCEHIHRTKTHANDLVKWPFLDEPNFYLPLLRAAVSLPGLNANKIIKEIDDKKITYNQGIWEALLSKLTLEDDKQGIQQLFNKYTMYRFEKEGKIPVPVREASSPAIPFPSAPYKTLDIKFIDAYLATLIDSQDISLVFDVLRTLTEQTNKLGISRSLLKGIVHLAKKEKSKDELQWFKDEVLPKVPVQNKSVRMLGKQIDAYLN
ncbi:uncharacterized protein BX663DRAFT_564595 [Cokeromyces recurvatus]|uniref:uncharacterized protein n=1 Tax=Cokeromyces recurvatus TaxID=90255 RepID=UPI00221FE022|nr:uncharacterized protein BX663DRAFT_564595 [Cokeromyces recurvatus]KAI7898638.1 hypothetical protein BX663DRAFT_564595 [Cokeromyces recurvatus]